MLQAIVFLWPAFSWKWTGTPYVMPEARCSHASVKTHRCRLVKRAVQKGLLNRDREGAAHANLCDQALVRRRHAWNYRASSSTRHSFKRSNSSLKFGLSAMLHFLSHFNHFPGSRKNRLSSLSLPELYVELTVRIPPNDESGCPFGCWYHVCAHAARLPE